MCNHCGCREYAPIAELTAEHVTILELASQVAQATRHQTPDDPAVRDQLLALLGDHAHKEEHGLYPLLIAEAGREPDAFDDLEAEHRELAARVEEGRFDHLAYYALERHIEEEEEELFSGALFHFETDTWEELEAIHRSPVA